jgi:hypothetical protein
MALAILLLIGAFVMFLGAVGSVSDPGRQSGDKVGVMILNAFLVTIVTLAAVALL